MQLKSKHKYQVNLATVVFPRRDDEVLLRRHPVESDRFAGLWNGLGGHVEPGENIRSAAVREVREESGLVVTSLRLRVVLHETGLVARGYVIFFFSASVESGTLQSEGDTELAWHDVEGLPNLPLVPDLPPLLGVLLGGGETVFATERYDGSDDPLALAVEGESVPLASNREGEAPS